MYCRQCGNKLYDTDRFCNRCGAPVNPGEEIAQEAYASSGLTPAAKDSERIIEEFYKSNRRKEDTQSILDMEFAAIKGDPVDLRDLSAIAYRGRDEYYAPAPQVPHYTPQSLRPEMQDVRPAPQFEDLFADMKPSVEEEQPLEEPVEEIIIEVEPEEEIIIEVEPEEEIIIEAEVEEDDEWAELFPQYTPVLFFDPPEYMLSDLEIPIEPEIAAEPEIAVEPEIAIEPEIETEPQPEPAPAPAPAQPTPAPAQPTQTATDALFAEAENNAAAIAASIGAFDTQKSSINQEAQATLDMLDKLFADFDKPIADSVGAASTPSYATSTYAAPNYADQPYSTPAYAAPTYTAQPSAAAHNAAADLDKYAPATASGIATGKAIQKAVLDPEEEPPEEGFEDDEDFLDEPIEKQEGDSAEAASAEEKPAEAAEKKPETKKEKKGFFRRKTKEEPVEIDEDEEEETSNIQKRSNVIVLNPEFLNPDEKASGKGTEDFKIAVNMTHGVRAMDREMPRAFDDDAEEYYEPRRGGNVIRKVMMGILTALLALAAIISILITFGRETTAGKAVLDFWDNIKGITSEEEAAPASEAELSETVETDTNNTSDSGANANANANTNESTSAETTEPETTKPEETPENAESNLRRKVNEGFNASEGGFGEAIEAPELTMEAGREYSLDEFYSSAIFVDGEWYKNESGESVTYNDAIFEMVSDYYSKLVERMNKDSDAVLGLIQEDSKLMTDVSGIKADAIVLHAITKLEVGEARKNGDSYYVIVRINEVTNDGKPASTYKRVLRLVADEETHTLKAAEIVVGD